MIRTARGAALASVLMLAACSGPSVGPTGKAPVEAPDRHDSPGVGPTQLSRAASVSVRTVDGHTLTLPDPQGHPTAVFFMAAWCLSCARVAATLDELYKQYRDKGFQVLAVDVDADETPQDLARFRQLAGNPGYFWAIDDGQHATNAYRVRSLDATIVMNAQGFVVFRSESVPDEGALRRAVAGLFR